ncbi:MAG TPA: hypothetical protein VJ770_02440, partial [Stellaceae bacterium]|nr:hypothetical protein [Stellaceae bacterium]
TASSGFAWTITNQGRISGPGNGIVLSATGAVLNSGTIAGTNGVVLDAGGSVQNSGGGVVNGSDYGVTIAGGAATVVSAGTIGGGGGTAVQFGAGDDLLAVYPGAVFNGRVLGGAGDNGLELTAGNGAGTLFGLGSKFRNFAAIQIDPGAVWRLSGAPATAPDFTNDGRIVVGGGHTLLLGAVGEDPGAHGAIVVRSGGTIEFAGGVDPQQTLRFADNTGTLVLDDPQDFGATIRGFQSGDAIDLAGAAADGMSYADGVLTLLSGDDPVAALAIPGGFSASQFAVTPDGRGGTTVTTVPAQLFAFTCVYDDGQAYYQGTVADDGSLGYAAIAQSADPTITVPGGVYTLAADGPTSEPSGAVRVADYFDSPPQANGAQGFVPLATGRGQFDGSGGLGSEADAIRVNGTTFGFSPSLEFHPILAA